MNWPWDTEKIQHETVLALLRGMETYLPDLAGLALPQADNPPSPTETGRRLARYLSEVWDKYRQVIELQQANLEAQKNHLIEVSKNSRAFADANLVLELDETKSALAEAREETRQFKLKVESGNYSREREQANHADDVRKLEAKIADLRRLLARKHLDLVDLMGDAYNAETPSETQS